jgi:hypothetical protein
LYTKCVRKLLCFTVLRKPKTFDIHCYSESNCTVDELYTGRDLKGSGRGLFQELSRHLPGRTEENTKTSVRIAGVPAKIQTKDHPNTSLNRYSYIIQVGRKGILERRGKI